MAKKKYDIATLNKENGNNIVRDYLSGNHASTLAKKYLGNERDYRYIHYILEINGVTKRNRSEVKQLSDKTNLNPYLNGKHNFINSDYFKTWSHNMAYLLGYIATDGCISNGRVLRLGLQKQDSSFLEKVKQELEFSGEIMDKEIHNKQTNKTYQISYVNFYDKTLCNDLKDLKITENKSLTIGRFDHVPEEFEMSFLLGVFDGDGSIGHCGKSESYKNINFKLRFFSGSYDFISYIRDIMAKHGYTNANIIEEKRGRKNSFYSLCYSTKDAIKFYNDTYKDVSIWIDRKKEKYEHFLQDRKEYEQTIQNRNKLKIKINQII